MNSATPIGRNPKFPFVQALCLRITLRNGRFCSIWIASFCDPSGEKFAVVEIAKDDRGVYKSSDRNGKRAGRELKSRVSATIK